jgi:hypothetical protein
MYGVPLHELLFLKLTLWEKFEVLEDVEELRMGLRRSRELLKK